MSDPNLRVINYLNEYLETEHELSFAVLLNGEWGCGKTHFIKKYIENYSATASPQSDLKILYVSLFGVSKYKHIHDQIFAQLHPVLSSDTMKRLAKFGKFAIKIARNIDLDRDGEDDIDLSLTINEDIIKSISLNDSPFAIIFDDFERSLMKMKEVLGVINKFVESEKIKTIIIGDEEKLKSLLGKRNHKLYRDTKEKVIGKTFKIKSDFNAGYRSFSNRITDDRLIQFFADEENHVFTIFTHGTHNNLRHLNQTMWDWERFWKCIPDNFKDNKELMSDLFIFFSCFSIEIKAGSISASDIEDVSTIFSNQIVRKTDPKVKKSKFEEIMEKHNFNEKLDIVMPAKVWVSLFEEGYLEEEIIEETLKSSKYYFDENTPSWIKLWHFRDLDDAQFLPLLDNLQKCIECFEFKKPGEIMHVFGLLLSFSEKRLIDQTQEQIAILSSEYLRKLYDSGEIEIQEGYEHQWRDEGVWKHLGYAGKDLDTFKQIQDDLSKTIEMERKRRLKDAANSIHLTLSADPAKFYQILVLSRYNTGRYYNVPILAEAEAEKLFDVYKEIPNNNKSLFSGVFQKRYSYPDIRETLLDEAPLIKQLLKITLAYADSPPFTISKYVMKDELVPALESAIKLLTSPKVPANEIDETL